MIKIYDALDTVLNETELADIDVLSASSKQKINGLYSLTFVTPIQCGSSIIKDRIAEADGQYYRILRIRKVGNSKEYLEVYGESLFQVDMLDDFVSSFIYSDISVYDVLGYLLENTIYNVGTCSDLGLNEIALTNKNKSEILNEILTIWNGELEINGLTVSIKSAIGENRGVTFKKGKNLKGIEETEDITNVVTKLHYANKNETLGGTINSPYIGNYAKIKNQYMQFEADTQEELDALAQEYLSLNDQPNVNYKVDFADLYYTEEYASIKDLEWVDLGDVVTIEHDTLGINIAARILELEKDIAERKNTKVVLGNYQDSFFDFQVGLKDTKDTIDYAFQKRRLNAATLKGLKIIDETKDQISFEVTEEGLVKITGDAVVGGTLDANKVNIINFSADTGDVYYVYADNARVMQLTVDELMTMMAETGLEEYHFIHIHGEVQEWKSAYRKYYEGGSPYPNIQLQDSEGNLLYWADSSHKSMTKDSTSSDGTPLEPVMVHQYDIVAKRVDKFENIQLKNGTYSKAPLSIWGAGTTNEYPNRGKCYMYKDLDGFSIKYYSGVDGSERLIDINDNGIRLFTETGDIQIGNLVSVEPTNIDYYVDGLDVNYKDGTATDFTWQKDSQGRITSINNNTSGNSIAISWHDTSKGGV